MANSMTNALNTSLRLTGLTSGLDTDSIIKKLMSVEQIKVDKVKQDKQILEWKRDQYRDITNLLRGLYDDYFNLIKPSNNLKSNTAFTAFDAVSSNPELFSVKTATGVVIGSHSVVVNSIASAAAKTGLSGISSAFSGLTGASPVNMAEMKQGKQFTLNLDGDVRTIVLDKDYTGYTTANFATALNGLANTAFGAGKINIAGDDISGKLTFNPVITSSNLNIGDGTNTYLGSLGFSDGQSNTIGGSSDITDFTGGSFKIQIDSNAAVDVNVSSGAGNVDQLVTNVNSALIAAGLDGSVTAIKDPDNAGRIKFVGMDTTKKVTITAGSSNDMLSKVSIGNGSTINPLSGTIDFNVNDIGKDFNIKIDGGAPVYIELGSDYTSLTGNNLQDAIQNALDNAGVTGVSVSVSGGKVSFLNSSPHQIVMQKGKDGIRNELGFASAQSAVNRIDFTDSLANISQRLATPLSFGTDGKLDFTINNITFTFEQSQTMNDVINKVNNSNAGVTLSYDSLNDRFMLKSKTTGLGSVIDNSDDTVDGDNFFAAFKIKTTSQEAGGNAIRGTDASLTLDGTLVNRSTNSFSVQGLTFDLKAANPLTNATVAVSANSQELVDKIKSFVTKYNDVLDKINSKLTDKRDYKNPYLPLTDDQKSAMNETDIKNWEDKAKKGLLGGDKTLYGLANKLRKAFYEPIQGASTTMDKIGISTSSYDISGKLIVNEEKLKAAIADNYDAVVQVFTKDDSGISYLDSMNDAAQKGTRYSQSGVAQRLGDILQDYIRTSRDSGGLKGILLEKAGISGDLSEYKNTLATQINDKNTLIDSLTESMTSIEDRYYKQFAAMETALSEMNSQSAWLAQQFGGGQ